MKSTKVLHLVFVLVLMHVSCGLGLATESKTIRDVVITNVAIPDSCSQGDIVPVTVSAANKGSHRETFRVTLADAKSGKELANKEVTLAQGWKDGPEDVADLVFDAETEAKDFFGGGIVSGGDVNGDGFEDLLITASEWNGTQGRAYLYYGDPEMDNIADVIFTGGAVGDHFGAYLGVALANVNGDGYDDVLIGASGHNDDKGRVYIYYGGPNIDTNADVILDGEVGSGGRFGLGLAAGDIDSDGYGDILVGAQNYDHGRGRVYLFWGGETMDTTADLVFEGEGYPGGKPGNSGGRETQGWFGRTIDAGGDVNGDGYNDILIGAREWSNDRRGRAYLFFGNQKERMDVSCDYKFTGEAPRDEMGVSLKIFDVDRDGFGDVLLGARFAANYRGRVYLYWGKEGFDGSQADLVMEGEDASDMGGDDIACGYFNGDLYGDILVAAYNYPGHRRMEGRAYVFYGGSKSQMNAECDHIFDGEGNKLDYFGHLLSCGDVNNDGYDDALMGAWGYSEYTGRSYLCYGPFHDTTDITFNWDTANASIGKHTLKVEIPPVPGEQNTRDNVRTVTIEVKEARR